jgi:small conductance mechanosensitive channel
MQRPESNSGVVIGSLIGSVGLIGLAIGFAVRDVIENYLASVLLSLRQPFRPDDLVSIDGREGRVLRLNSRATMLMDLDGNHVRIPNSIVYKATIVNFDRNPARRFSFRIHVDPDQPLSQALSVAGHALAETPGILADPAPMVVPDAFGEASTDLLCHAWINQQQVDLAKVRGAALIAIQTAFARAGIAMPVPRYAVSVTRAGTELVRPPAYAGQEAADVDVGRADQTLPFRETEAGENLLAEDGRTE